MPRATATARGAHCQGQLLVGVAVAIAGEALIAAGAAAHVLGRALAEDDCAALIGGRLVPTEGRAPGQIA